MSDELKRGSWNDYCRLCGREIGDDKDCPNRICLVCQKNPPKKESITMSSTTSTLVKDIVVARAGRNFVNGKQAFDLTRDNIDEIIRNFDVLKKQVPLILAPEHLFGAKKSAIPASGWVESMYRAGDDWHARVKLVGDAATFVANDQFRGVSIGTVNALDLHGRPVGEALDHLLITNSPFFANLNM